MSQTKQKRNNQLPFLQQASHNARQDPLKLQLDTSNTHDNHLDKSRIASRKHAYIILTPWNPTFIL